MCYVSAVPFDAEDEVHSCMCFYAESDSILKLGGTLDAAFADCGRYGRRWDGFSIQCARRHDPLMHTVISPQNQTPYIGPTTTKMTIQDFLPNRTCATPLLLTFSLTMSSSPQNTDKRLTPKQGGVRMGKLDIPSYFFFQAQARRPPPPPSK